MDRETKLNIRKGCGKDNTFENSAITSKCNKRRVFQAPVIQVY